MKSAILRISEQLWEGDLALTDWLHRNFSIREVKPQSFSTAYELKLMDKQGFSPIISEMKVPQNARYVEVDVVRTNVDPHGKEVHHQLIQKEIHQYGSVFNAMEQLEQFTPQPTERVSGFNQRVDDFMGSTEPFIAEINGTLYRLWRFVDNGDVFFYFRRSGERRRLSPAHSEIAQRAYDAVILGRQRATPFPTTDNTDSRISTEDAIEFLIRGTDIILQYPSSEQQHPFSL